jgi:hypothetical protein
VLLSHFAFRQKLTGDGARQIIAICSHGNALDFQNLFLDVRDHSVQTPIRGTVASLSREQTQGLATTLRYQGGYPRDVCGVGD